MIKSHVLRSEEDTILSLQVALYRFVIYRQAVLLGYGNVILFMSIPTLFLNAFFFFNRSGSVYMKCFV
jgi:hypothetical protein